MQLRVSPQWRFGENRTTCRVNRRACVRSLPSSITDIPALPAPGKTLQNTIWCPVARSLAWRDPFWPCEKPLVVRLEKVAEHHRVAELLANRQRVPPDDYRCESKTGSRRETRAVCRGRQTQWQAASLISRRHASERLLALRGARCESAITRALARPSLCAAGHSSNVSDNMNVRGKTGLTAWKGEDTHEGPGSGGARGGAAPPQHGVCDGHFPQADSAAHHEALKALLLKQSKARSMQNGGRQDAKLKG